MKKEEAIEMVSNLKSIYPFENIHFNIPNELKGRSEDERSNRWYEENGWYVAIWIDNDLVSTLNDYQQLATWKKFARIIVQADEDIQQADREATRQTNLRKI
jgi:hypothetical protein